MSMSEPLTTETTCTRCGEVILNLGNAVTQQNGYAHEPCSHVPENCRPVMKWCNNQLLLVGYTTPTRSRKSEVFFRRAIIAEEPIPRPPKINGGIRVADPLRGISKKQRREERALVKAWMKSSDAAVAMGGLPTPMSVLIPIPPARIEAYMQQIRPTPKTPCPTIDLPQS